MPSLMVHLEHTKTLRSKAVGSRGRVHLPHLNLRSHPQGLLEGTPRCETTTVYVSGFWIFLGGLAGEVWGIFPRGPVAKSLTLNKATPKIQENWKLLGPLCKILGQNCERFEGTNSNMLYLSEREIICPTISYVACRVNGTCPRLYNLLVCRNNLIQSTSISKALLRLKAHQSSFFSPNQYIDRLWVCTLAFVTSRLSRFRDLSKRLCPSTGFVRAFL